MRDVEDAVPYEKLDKPAIITVIPRRGGVLLRPKLCKNNAGGAEPLPYDI